jgi:outer membrane lipoprotein LolB
VRLRASACCLLLFAAFSGCKTSPSVGPIARDSGALTQWQAGGRIAVSGAGGGGSGSFTWTQDGEHADVQLRGPVGIGSMKLTLSESEIRIATGDGQEFTAEDAQQELAARLGAEVPLKDLRYWLVGVAAPGEHRWSEEAESATLTQHDWRIDYQRFGTSEGVRLPMKMVAISGPAQVRIVVDRWKLR